jgi:hypothetical protein
MNMTVEQLYTKLSSKEFQDTENGDLFYNFYIFQYPACDEYVMRKQILDFKAKLIRPCNFIDVLTLNLFDEFCKFLDEQPFGKKHPSYLKYLLEKDNTDHDAVTKSLIGKANSKQFYEYLHQRIMDHITIDDDKIRPYVFMYGIGNMFPYTRTNELLTNYEKYNQSNKYKIIVFYPGHSVDNNFSLFDLLNDQHAYRATLLIND